MRFNIIYGNHGASPVHIEDLLKIVKCGLTQAGHYVTYDNVVMPQACNVLLECFTDETADMIVDAARNGYTFVTIVTEFVTGDTFNNRANTSLQTTNPSHDWYSNHAVWKNRFDTFCKVAAVSRAIWCVADGQLEGYLRITDRRNVHVLPLHYVDGYATVQHQSDETKDIDFLFTGTLNERRCEILDKLRAAGAYVVGAATNTPTFIRDNFIGRSKICLNLMQTDAWTDYSSIRFYYHVMNSSYLVSERAAPAPGGASFNPMNAYVDIFDKEPFVDICLALLKEAQFTARGRQKHAAFKQAAGATSPFSNLLDVTFAASHA